MSTAAGRPTRKRSHGAQRHQRRQRCLCACGVTLPLGLRYMEEPHYTESDQVAVERAAAGGWPPRLGRLSLVALSPIDRLHLNCTVGGKRVRALPGHPPAATAALAVWQRELDGGLPSEARWRGFSHCRLLREWDCFQGEGPHQVWWPPYFLR